MENLDRIAGIAFAGCLASIAFPSFKRIDARAVWLRISWIVMFVAITLTFIGIVYPRWIRFGLAGFALMAMLISFLRREPRPDASNPLAQARLGLDLTMASLQRSNKNGEEIG
ncbi:MAG: hypothetical protein ABR584_02575 [Candidatus Baltobacteraceae bacterium]